MELKNKVVVVTGAGRGIGRQIALDLAKAGCAVFACARSGDELESLKRDCGQAGAPCDYLAADLSSIANVNLLADRTIERFGRIDILVNNAGVLFQDGVLNVTEDEWDLTMSVNLKASFFLAQRALKDMMTRKCGYIINMVSTAALCVPPGITSYGASKAGMVGASQALYEEAKRHGVKVSMIYPGMTDTGMLRAAGTGTLPEQWMLPEDISNCVLFLLKSSDRMVVKEIIPWASGHDQI